MDIRKLLTKVFLGLYLLLLFPHLAGLSPSFVVILFLVLGVVFAFVAHQSKYALLATFFLVFHMALETPHMIEHAHHEGLGVIFGHGLHVLFDLVLLYALVKSWKYFLGFLLLVFVSSLAFAHFLVFIESTKPFVLGGVLGCVLIHLLFLNIKKPTT